jgi:hypothetical protein
MFSLLTYCFWYLQIHSCSIYGCFADLCVPARPCVFPAVAPQHVPECYGQAGHGHVRNKLPDPYGHTGVVDDRTVMSLRIVLNEAVMVTCTSSGRPHVTPRCIVCCFCICCAVTGFGCSTRSTITSLALSCCIGYVVCSGLCAVLPPEASGDYPLNGVPQVQGAASRLVGWGGKLANAICTVHACVCARVWGGPGKGAPGAGSCEQVGRFCRGTAV